MKSKKIHIKHIFIARAGFANSSEHVHYVSMLTDNLKYIDYEFIVKQTSLSFSLSYRIIQLMQPFCIDKNTTVVLHDSVKEFSPLHLYFIILHQHIPFTLQYGISTASLVRRICSFHHTYVKNKKCSEINEQYFNKVWKKLVKHKACSWINANIDAQIQQHGDKVRRRKQLARVGAYYMVIRSYLMDIHNRSINKKNIDNEVVIKNEDNINSISSQTQTSYFDITV